MPSGTDPRRVAWGWMRGPGREEIREERMGEAGEVGEGESQRE
jgi:hypothetical protein